MNDVVLITIDCWRNDAADRMPNLQALTKSYEQTSVICQAPATRGAFPALLAGSYYPEVYDGFTDISPDTKSLHEVLSDTGYATGGVIASNPFLSAWKDGFDYFWNGGFEDEADGLVEKLRYGRHQLSQAMNYGLLRSEVPVDDVVDRAESWYEAQSGPRFLWMHLMDLHAPFFPGLGRAAPEGLFDAYLSHLRFMRDPDSVSAADWQTLENLYWRCVDYLDEQLTALFDFIDDDATVVVVGDHGEEFQHDEYGHARLYDECVQVPLFATSNVADSLGGNQPVQQMDVPASILDAIGVDVPDSWTGMPARDREDDTAFMLNHSPMFGRTYAGIRTPQYKVMKTFDEDTGDCLATEAYDLMANPGETRNILGETPAVRELEHRLDSFLDQPEIKSGIHEHPSEGTSAAVENRLEALGYR